jgi:hypothetical protein
MHKLLLIAGVAALVIPSFALAQDGDMGSARAADAAAADTAYVGAADDIAARENWLERHIHKGDSSGALRRGDAEHDFDVLGGIRQFEARQSDQHAGLTGVDRADILNKIDNLTAIVRSQWTDNGRSDLSQ